MTSLPVLFVAHGAPTVALNPGPWGAALAESAAQLASPRAILVVSPHWDTAEPALGAALQPQTIHDFSGFARELYALRYPAPGAPAIAVEAKNLLEDAGFEAAIDVQRGLDHGAWIPLRLMFPAATIPVVPLSIQSRRDPAHHYRLGQALQPLTRQGVLIVASGNLTHNLTHFRFTAPGADMPPAYFATFTEWIWQRLAAHDVAALQHYRRDAPGAIDAHPTDEHLLPLFVALGAAGERFDAQRIFGGVYDHAIAMDSFALQPLSHPDRLEHTNPQRTS